MSAAAGTTAPPRRQKDGCHHAPLGQRVDVHRISTPDGLTVRRENLLDHRGILRQPLCEWNFDVVRTQRRETFGHVAQTTHHHPVPNISPMTSVARLDPVRARAFTYRAFRFGRPDPSVHLGASGIVIASDTPGGAAWMSADSDGRLDFGGAGADDMAARRPDPAGTRDAFTEMEARHPLVERLQAEFSAIRVGASADVYKVALTATLGQRITAAEAVAQWARLCRSHGHEIDTPAGKLITPPPAQHLASLAPFQLHRLGIEENRARTLITIARVFARSGTHHHDPQLAHKRLCAEVPRYGRWTRALVEAEALGDPDAVPVGDFHLKNVVAYALAGRPRGTDEEMLTLLAPYSGQRGRVLMWLALAGVSAPKFGPRRRNPDIRRL